MLLSVVMPICNGVRRDYPFVEAVRSALPIADEVLLLCPESDTDGTRESCEGLARVDHRVRVLLHDWWQAERKEEALSEATNRLIEAAVGTYYLALQADEVLHEDQAPLVRSLAEQGRYELIHFGRLNFFGRFDRYNNNISRWPIEVCRLARRDCYPRIRSYGDATHLGIFDRVVETPRLDAQDLLQFWHYAYVRLPRAYVERQYAMSDLYGWSRDPRIEKWERDGRITWDEMAPAEEFVPIPSEHPQVMQRWIAEHREAVESGLL